MVALQPVPTPTEITAAAAHLTATVGATRTGDTVQAAPTLPPPPALFAPADLDGCDEMRWYRVAAGLPAAFDGIGWRESNCRNEDGVHTSCCYGYWQISRIHIDGTGSIYGRDCQVYTVADLNSDTPADKLRQACTARALYDADGLSPWAATR